MMGLGEGGRKRAGAMLYLVGLPSYKNLGEAVQALLTRHLVAFRRTRVSNAQHSGGQTQMPSPPIKLLVKVMPALAPIREAREEERFARYEQVIALRKQGMPTGLRNELIQERNL